MGKIIVPENKLILLDHTRAGPMAERFYEFAKTRFVGQPRVVRWLAQMSESIFQGFYPARGPLGSVLLVGPSGAGKTLAAELLAWFLFGDPEGFSRIDGQEMALRENIARVIGASPGYVGYDDPPMITQKSLDEPAYLCILENALNNATEGVRREYHNIQEERRGLLAHITGLGKTKSDQEELALAVQKIKSLNHRTKALGIPEYDRRKYTYISILLLDEIERAHSAFHNLLYRILDEGKLPIVSKNQNMGSGFIDFRRTIIIATSNLGEEELKNLFKSSSGRSLGYSFMRQTYTSDELDQATYRICNKAIESFFPMPLLNRFGDKIAARIHSREEHLQVLDIELNKIRDWLFDPEGCNFPIVIRVEDSVKAYLADEMSESLEKGVRFLQQKLKTHLVDRIISLKATGQVCAGDILIVSTDPISKEFVFHKEHNPTAAEKIIKTS